MLKNKFLRKILCLVISISLSLTVYVPSLASDYVGFECTYKGSDKVTMKNYELIGSTLIEVNRIRAGMGEPTIHVVTWYDGYKNRYDTYEWESYNIVPWIRVTFRNGIYYSKSECMLQYVWTDL